MKKKLMNNWPAKLATLVVAMVIWFLIKYMLYNENVRPSHSRIFELRG